MQSASLPEGTLHTGCGPATFRTGGIRCTVAAAWASGADLPAIDRLRPQLDVTEEICWRPSAPFLRAGAEGPLLA
jgi:hypothetical protein